MIKRALTSKLHVSNQILPTDLRQLAEQGFTTIINSRPDGEVPGQVMAKEMRSAARAHGLSYIYLPVKLESINVEDAIAFARHVDEAPGKVLGHCRTGTRSTTLWALSQVGKLPADEILARAKKLGYGLESIRDRLR